MHEETTAERKIRLPRNIESRSGGIHIEVCTVPARERSARFCATYVRGLHAQNSPLCYSTDAVSVARFRASLPFSAKPLAIG